MDRPNVPALIAAELRQLAQVIGAMAHPGDALPEPHTLAMVAALLLRRADDIERPPPPIPGRYLVPKTDTP